MVPRQAARGHAVRRGDREVVKPCVREHRLEAVERKTQPAERRLDGSVTAKVCVLAMGLAGASLG